MSTTIMSDAIEHVVTHQWLGATNNFPSVELVDGVESRRNLVQNPNFDAALTYWGVGSSGSQARDTTVFHSGTASLKFTAGVGVQTIGAAYQGPNIPVQFGQAYTLSWWAFIPADLTATYSTAIVFYDANNVYVGYQLSATPLQFATDWTRVSLSVDVPETATSLTFVLLNSYGTRATVAEVIYVDDVLLEYGSDTLPYFDGNTEPSVTYGSSTPLLVDGWEESVETRTVVNTIVGGGIDITPYPAGLRTGQYTAVFQDEDEAAALVRMHQQPARFTIQDSDRPSIGMLYVPVGTITRALDDESREFWEVTIPYQEVDG